MTIRQDRAYRLMQAQSGAALPDSTETNNTIYKVLCRETHARPRLDSMKFEINRERNMVEVSLPERSIEGARQAVLSGVEISVDADGADDAAW